MITFLEKIKKGADKFLIIRYNRIIKFIGGDFSGQ